MTYTSAELLTIIAAFGVLVTTIGGVAVSIITSSRNGRKTDNVAVVVAETYAETKAVAGKVEQVHTLTNSNLSAVKAELATAVSKIESLHDVVKDLKAEREKASVAAALATPVPQVVQETSAPQVEMHVETLENIELHTKQTALNTAKTQSDMKTMKDNATDQAAEKKTQEP